MGSALCPHTGSASPLHAEAAQLAGLGDSGSLHTGRSSPPPRGDVLSVAPMMEWTDRHYRFLARLLTRRTRLYTEMVVDNTLRHSPVAAGYLRFDPVEHPVACQIGGSDPESLAQAARMVEAAGYDEVNLNCGCPSPKVAGKGCFGAALMYTPEVVRDCVAAMCAVVSIPVTVKCRLGVDALDSYEAFAHFVATVAAGGCTHFIVHSRKAFLKGLDPKANRTVPPLRYSWVQRIALEMPHLRISLNGGIVTLAQSEQLLSLARTGPPLSFLEVEAAAEAEEEEGGAAEACPASTGTPPAQLASLSLSAAAAAEEAALGAGSAPVDGSSGGAGAGRSHPPVWTGPREEPEAARARLYGVWKLEKERKMATEALAQRLSAGQFFSPGARQGPVRPGAYANHQDSLIDSIMIGRAAYNNSWILADVDRRLFGVPNPGLSRREVLAAFLDYAEGVGSSVPPAEASMHLYRPFELAKPLFGLFAGEYGCAKFRLTLARSLQEEKLGLREAVGRAIKHLPDDVLDERPPTS
jgi:tRNA-dihydrouridine synthase